MKLARGPVGRRRASPGAREAFRTAKLRARKARDAAERGVLLMEAGDVARTGLHRPDLAVAYYLRALRFDPQNVGAFEAAREVLAAQRRWRRLERVYWRLLATLPLDSPIVREVLGRLVELYSGPFRHPVRGRALERLAARLDLRVRQP